MNIINLNITEAEDEYIIHQSDCISIHCTGLSKHIDREYPFACVHNNRKEFRNTGYATFSTRDTIGTIRVGLSNKNIKKIITLFTQYNPGKIKDNMIYYSEKAKLSETDKIRVEWFKISLEKVRIYLIENFVGNVMNIGIPYNIGCGPTSGGDWTVYYKILEEWYDSIDSFAKVTLYKYNKI